MWIRSSPNHRKVLKACEADSSQAHSKPIAFKSGRHDADIPANSPFHKCLECAKARAGQRDAEGMFAESCSRVAKLPFRNWPHAFWLREIM